MLSMNVHNNKIINNNLKYKLDRLYYCIIEWKDNIKMDLETTRYRCIN
jgi:hypothetical protein